MKPRIFLALLMLLSQAGCKPRPLASADSQLPIVTVSQPIRRAITDYIDYTGRTEAVNAVDIRARVTGYLVKMPFKEGDELKKDDLLFQIDPRPYQAQLDQAEANVKLAQAELKLAKANNARAQVIAKTPGAISKQDLDQYQAAEEEAAAQVTAAQAALESYQLNRDFCEVTSPIDGKVSRYYYTLGNLISQDATLLTTIVSLDPIYAYFDIDERTVLRVRNMINQGKLMPIRNPEEIKVLMGVQGEPGFPHEGHVNFINNTVDPFTGTITFRGVFDNPKPAVGVRLLSPGMFVRVRVPLGEPHEALLVNDRAVGTDQGLKYLYVVGTDKKVEYRRVTLGSLQDDGLRAIDQGLKADDWVVVSGLQQIRPPMEVSPERMDMPIPTAQTAEAAEVGGTKSSADKQDGTTKKPTAQSRDKKARKVSGVRMISHFFIDRPIFASVLSIVITLTGGIAMISLPITQYPPIAPPTIIVSINYPGASSQVVADTIGAPVEQQVNGVEGMLYMSSFSANDGTYSLTVTFDLGFDLNTALVMVQNRVALALPQLPDTVQMQGITIRKKTPNILMVVNFYSPDGRYDDIYLSNYATINVRDELLRIEGVSDITYLGQRDYSIRAWLDPQLLASRDITASEVSGAIQAQSLAAPIGQINQQPSPPARAFQNPLDTLGRLATPEQFGEIIVKITQGSQDAGSPQIVRLKDVAQLELGATNYNQFALLNGQPTVGLAVFQLPGTNALDVAERIKSKMAEVEKRFPEGLAFAIRHDTTPFIRESVNDVIKTLLEAVALVAIVVLLFLQNWRASLIPLIAVPVAIVGTFSIMQVFGFSLNNISLFGLVLSIGIVVDDAIVVVENVERWLEHGLPARQAARKAMEEVTSPVIAVAVVLCAVFVPCAFISGITGQFFRQFAVTIATSTIISAFNSLTLSPALAAILLKPRGAAPDPLERLLNFSLGWLFRLFDWGFTRGTNLYAGIVGWALRLCLIVLLLYGGLLGLTWWMFNSVPTGFIPQQDQGYLLVNVQLPDSASVQRTQAVMKRVEALARKIDGVSATVSVSGTSTLLSVNSSNFGSMYVTLKDFDQRRSPAQSADAIMAKLRKVFAREIREATVGVFGAPPVPGIGTASGFKLMVEDRGSLGLDSLQQQTDRLVLDLSQQKWLIGVFTLFRAHAPQLFMDIDRTKVRSMGVSLDDLNQTLTIFLGSSYVNNFNAFGRYWQVNIQAEGTFRNRVDDLNQIKVRNDRGEMAPLGTLVNVSDSTGPVMVNRYNLYSSAPINGGIYPTMGSGQAIAFIDDSAQNTLPRSMKTEWTELTLMQIRAGNTAMYVFALAVIFVFLALAALYESWTLPLAVILVVPMCLLSSIIGVALSHLLVDIFVQIGFVVLVGLACKNAILIVEFAKRLREEGQPLGEATREASRLRLRPIVMTSLAFILGVVPLVIAKGAGAEMRQSLGTAVFSGMLGVTLFGIFLTPVFFYVIEWLGESRLLASRTIQTVGSVVWGGLAGGLVAVLLWNMEVVGGGGATVIGVVLAVSVTVLVQRASRRRPEQAPAAR